MYSNQSFLLKYLKAIQKCCEQGLRWNSFEFLWVCRSFVKNYNYIMQVVFLSQSRGDHHTQHYNKTHDTATTFLFTANVHQKYIQPTF